MQRLRRNSRGLAEIVGTLMLVLIVVAAAVAFSVFVASYQTQVQSQEAYQHDQSLESIRIQSVSPTLNLTTGDFENVSFVLDANEINPSTVTEIAINGDPARSYHATELLTNVTPAVEESVTVPFGENFVLYSEDAATITINCSDPDIFVNPQVMASTDYVKIDVYTAYQNDFSRTFVPPAAVALVNTVSEGTSPILFTVLDGSLSTQPEGNASLASWDWTVYNVTDAKSNPGSPSGSYSGEEVTTSAALYVGTYYVVLQVTNTDGLVGIDNVTYNST
jgi:flagellin-like protein